MRIPIPRLAPVCVLLGANFTLVAQSKVYPFEAPPILRSKSEPAAELTSFVRRATPKQNCDPDGALERRGNIVSATLNLMRADFTINNPDLSSPNGGEDPVTLR